MLREKSPCDGTQRSDIPYEPMYRERRPRYPADAISEMYKGAATVEMPIPKPPMNPATVNAYTSVGKLDQTADTIYRTPTPSNVSLRPKRSGGQPPSNAPITVP